MIHLCKNENISCNPERKLCNVASVLFLIQSILNDSALIHQKRTIKMLLWNHYDCEKETVLKNKSNKQLDKYTTRCSPPCYCHLFFKTHTETHTGPKNLQPHTETHTVKPVNTPKSVGKMQKNRIDKMRLIASIFLIILTIFIKYLKLSLDCYKFQNIFSQYRLCAHLRTIPAPAAAAADAENSTCYSV